MCEVRVNALDWDKTMNVALTWYCRVDTPSILRRWCGDSRCSRKEVGDVERLEVCALTLQASDRGIYTQYEAPLIDIDATHSNAEITLSIRWSSCVIAETTVEHLLPATYQRRLKTGAFGRARLPRPGVVDVAALIWRLLERCCI